MTTPLQKRLNRLYLPQAQAVGQVLDLTEEFMHYLSRVLRLLDGSEIVAWNGQGDDFLGEIRYQSKKLVQIHLTEGPFDRRPQELRSAVHVLQGLPEGDKMDWVLEKCTELGAAGFVPVQAHRSVVKLKGERMAKRQAHWERVVQSAGCQSERGLMPAVKPIEELESALQQFQAEYPGAEMLFFHPAAETSLSDWCKTPSVHHPSPQQPAHTQPLLIAVGPEGGWTPEEVETAQRLGAKTLRFSRRILRTETFALACLSQLTARLQLDE